MTEADELDRKAKSRRPFALAALFLVLCIVFAGASIVGAVVSTSASNEARARDKAQDIEQDYQSCLRSNESRSGIRDQVNQIADEQSVFGDPSVIPDADAPQLAQALRVLVAAGQNAQKARADDFRARNLAKFQPRNCEEEKATSQSKANGG